MVVSMFRLKSRRWFDRTSLSSELEGVLGARVKEGGVEREFLVRLSSLVW